MAGFNITVAGDSAINLEFGNVISEKRTASSAPPRKRSKRTRSTA